MSKNDKHHKKAKKWNLTPDFFAYVIDKGLGGRIHIKFYLLIY